MTLDEILIELYDYGKPRLSYVMKGWLCCVDMNTNTVGATFEIKSDFDHTTPREAATVCYTRVKSAVAQFKNHD